MALEWGEARAARAEADMCRIIRAALGVDDPKTKDAQNR